MSEEPDLAGFSRIAALTQEFYAWEVRGRGWQVWEHPVGLEPPFRPFFRGANLPVTPAQDDGRRETAFSRFLDQLLGRRPPMRPEPSPPVEEPKPEPFSFGEELVELQLVLPRELALKAEQVQAFLLSLSGCAKPVAFDLLASARDIRTQIACAKSDEFFLRQQFQLSFPTVSLRRVEAQARPFIPEGSQVFDIGLANEFMCPLRTDGHWNVSDPIGPLVAALGVLEGDETAVFQVLLERARAPWAESTLRAVTTWSGEPFFPDAPGMVKQAEEKLSSALFAVGMRVAVHASDERRMQILRGIDGALATFADPTSNALVFLEEDCSTSEDVQARQTRKSGMLLNAAELAGLIHPPADSVSSPRLVRDTGRTRLAPEHLTGHAYILGESEHLGESRTVSLPKELRLRHIHIIGATGTGKSNLMLNLITQDMENGEGLAVFDPHGDLIEDVLQRVPEGRIQDVILIDPSDAEHIVPFNVLQAHSDVEKTLIASDFVGIFRRLSTSWGDQMTAVLSNAVLAMLESDRGGNLADLRQFLTDKEFRQDYLLSVREPDVREYWVKEFPRLSGQPELSILARLSSFLRQKPLKAMVSGCGSALNFAEAMDQGRIVLCKLSRGLIGEENSALLGALLLGKFQQLALARQAHTPAERRPFYIYADEFQHVATPSLTTLLSGGRKYAVGLILAHQETRQIATQNPELLAAVGGNTATTIAFRVGMEDAKRLETTFAHFEGTDLAASTLGKALASVQGGQTDFSLQTRWSSVQPGPSLARLLAIRSARRERPHIASLTVSDAGHEDLVSSAERNALSVRASQRNPTLTRTGAPHPGRGGSQHKYAQSLIQKWGETNGWRVSIEEPVLDGMGIVDVALRRGDMKIACEIASTTSNEHEVRNVQKCLGAGFSAVVVVSVDRKRNRTLLKALSTAFPEDSRVQVLTLDRVFDFLHRVGAAEPAAKTPVHGYAVNVTGHSASKRASRTVELIVAALNRLRE